MRVVVVSEPGGPEVLTVEQRPDPVAGPGEAVVAVQAASINPTDLAARQGHVFGGFRPPYVLGWDFTGTVTSVGEGVTTPAVGDPVVGMIPWYDAKGTNGAYAEAVAVPVEWLVPRPAGQDELEAATIPLNALTAVQAFKALAPTHAAPVLVTGASGGVGVFAVQLLAQSGHEVTAVAGRDDEDFVRSLGASTVLPRDTGFDAIGRFDFLLDCVPVGESAYAAVNDGGRVVELRKTADAPRGIRKDFVLIQADQDALRGLVLGVADGQLRTRVARTFPLDQAAEAHRAYEAGGTKGKILLVP